MSILASLARAYERLPDAPPYGYSAEKIGFVISLNRDGTVANVTDLRSGEGKKRMPRTMLVPQPVKRTVAIAPNFLWDKTSYVLGVSLKEGGRAADEHAAFVERHGDALENETDEGLRALLAFLKRWQVDDFKPPVWPEDMKDQNVVFALERERLANTFIHERPAAKALWGRLSSEGDKTSAICLVSGQNAPVARLHPAIKGVWGAQSSGASIVSFNLDAFASYGHDQGDNAPVSEAIAFAYTTALNRFLEKGSKHRIQIGDASTVFWADAPTAEAADDAESLFAAFVDGGAGDEVEAAKVGNKLDKIRKGLPLKEVEPKLAEGVRFYVLGLAPNAARLSIRFYFEDDFGVLTKNYQDYWRDMMIEPWPEWKRRPGIYACTLRTAPARWKEQRILFDRDHVSPLLSGEFTRAILTSARFPGGLLSLLLTRIRADRILEPVRVALLKALIVRSMRLDGRLPRDNEGNIKEEYLVRSDPHDPNPARRLGRLFAVLEKAQLDALGDDINTTIKDKFLGSAAATPRKVFTGLIKLSIHHTKRLRNGHSDAKWIKDSDHARHVGQGHERDIGELWGSFPEGVPSQHSPEEQGLFLVGYYQERYGKRNGKASADSSDVADEDTSEIEEVEK